MPGLQLLVPREGFRRSPESLRIQLKQDRHGFSTESCQAVAFKVIQDLDFQEC